MNKKVVFFIALATLFAGLAAGLNIGANVEIPGILPIVCLGVTVISAGIASAFGKKVISQNQNPANS